MEVKAGYKQTEVGIIPEDWNVRPCSSLSDLITVGIVIRPTQYYVKQGVPALRSANVREEGINDFDMVFISEKANRLLSKSQLRAGDVVSVRTGYPGTSAVVPANLAGANCIDLLITRPSKVVNSNFLAYWINSSHGKDQVLRNQGGLAQQHFNVGELRNLVVALPPTLAEQEAIAETLSDVDALIEALEQLIAKKRQVKQGAMQELLTGKRRLSGFSGEWKVKRIGEITHTTAGGTPSTLVASYWGGDIRWMSSGELHLKRVYEVEGRITEDGLKNSSTKIVPPKCVLIGLAGQGKTRGTVAMNMVELCTNQSIAAIFPSPSFVSEYLFFNLDIRYEELREVSSGDGGRGGLNLTLISKLEIPLPSIPEQTAIAEILSDMDAEIAALEAKLTKARQVKQGMMQELLTGRMRLI